MRWISVALVATVSLTALSVTGCSKKKEETASKELLAKSVASVPENKVKGANPGTIQTIAMAALTAYRDKDLAKLAELGPPDAKSALIFLEPRNPNYEKLLGDDTWRMKSLRAWDGKVTHTFIGNQFAQVLYHEDGDTAYVIELWSHDDGRWAFHDIRQLKRDAFMAQLKMEPPPKE